MTRTIPNEAWRHVSNAVFRDGHLYPDTVQRDGTYPDSTDAESIYWLAQFTLDNYSEWASATVMCPRAPTLEETLFRFDNVSTFITYGYRNPYREAGVPDWYFFWTKNYRLGELKRFARAQGLLPSKDLPLGPGGYGIGTGLRGLG